MLSIKIAILLGALEAVAIGPVPLEWLALMLWIVAAVWIWPSMARGMWLIIMLIVWAGFVHAGNLIGCEFMNCSALNMPAGATTSYPVYIALRFFVLFAFLAALALASKLVREGHREELIGFIVNLGAWIAGIAIYVYAAQLTGLPDIPRTRLGTDGQTVSEVAFTYAFHRALGTFREPSHLAAWLVLPFFLSMTRGLLNWRSVLIGGALMLTGSLTAFMSIGIGALAAWGYLLLRGIKDAGWLFTLPFKAAALVGLALIPFYLIVSGDDSNLITLLIDRAGPIFEYGIRESNRGYVYDYAAETDFPFFGDGLGNSTLYFTDWMRVDVVAGFLSLYINVLFSLGLVGLSILALFLVRPLIYSQHGVTAREAWPLYAAYMAWLVIFTVHAAELPIMFAIMYALMPAANAYESRRSQSVSPQPSSKTLQSPESATPSREQQPS